MLLKVELFVNASAREVEKIMQITPVHVLQFHGEEMEFLLSIWPSLIKSVLMRVGKDIEKIARTFHSWCQCFVI